LGLLVVDGCIRDTPELFRTGFPAWCTGIGGGHVTKQQAGAVNVPIVCAGVIVNPGDLVIAEDDGVIIVPGSIAAEAAEVARERLAVEEKQLRVFSEDGPMLFENYVDNYRKLGMQEFDRAWDDR
jgi:4-hydroxy-4-methyl-2-oxoglutarate aldolase